MTQENKTYKYEDIFQDIPGDPDNTLMTIPPEIYEKMGWDPGDVIKITVLEEGGLALEKVKDAEE